MVVVRFLQFMDGYQLFNFFMRLSDETVTLSHNFGKVNEKEQANLAVEKIARVSDKTVYWVATEPQPPVDDRIVGLSWLTFGTKPTQRYTCSLGMVVADAYQGQGIGKKLIEAMIAEAKKRGMRKIWLQTYPHNHRATNLYAKFGFKEEGYFVNQEWDGDKPLHVMSMGLLLENSNLEWCEPK